MHVHDHLVIGREGVESFKSLALRKRFKRLTARPARHNIRNDKREDA